MAEPDPGHFGIPAVILTQFQYHCLTDTETVLVSLPQVILRQFQYHCFSGPGTVSVSLPQ